MSTVSTSAGGSSGLAKWLVVAAIVVVASVGVAVAGTSKLIMQTTASGLQYQMLKVGTGDSPIASDTVLVNYEGRLADGKVFDSSYQRNQPAAFRLDQVIPGWTEGLQLMKKGGKARFVVPPQLAYGDRDMGGGVIPANSTLTFEVELLDIAPRQPQ